MQIPYFSKVFTILALTGSLVFSASLPISVSAKTTISKNISTKKKVIKRHVSNHRVSVSRIKGADEKEIINPTTRCLTPTIKAMHDKAVKQMNEDIEKLGTGHEDAVKAYQTNIQMIWEAMSEPYCGFGKGRVATVIKGFDKSVNASRTKFLAATK